MLAGGLLLDKSVFAGLAAPDFTSKRPPLAKRNFTSKAVENAIVQFKSNVKDKELGWLFENCFPNTLDTTVFYAVKNSIPDTYVITGDIDAMWLRDSCAQVWPYMAFIKKDEKLKRTNCRRDQPANALCFGGSVCQRFL